MSITVTWDNDAKTVIRLDYSVTWTWEEFDQAVDEMVSLVQPEKHRVDVISNTPPRASFPIGFPLRHFQRAARMFPPNIDLILVVSVNSIVRKINAGFFRLYPALGKRTTFVASLEEARAYLEEARADDLTAVP